MFAIDLCPFRVYISKYRIRSRQLPGVVTAEACEQASKEARKQPVSSRNTEEYKKSVYEVVTSYFKTLCVL
jgi:hypothetical protein